MTVVDSKTIPEFGIKRENEERRDGGAAVVFDPATGLFAVGLRESDGLFILFSGGVEEEEDITEGICREVTEESGLHNFARVEILAEAWAHYRHPVKKVNRVAKATCLLIVLRDTHAEPQQLEAHEQFSLVWKKAEEILANWREQNHDHGLDHWIYFFEQGLARLKEGGYL